MPRRRLENSAPAPEPTPDPTPALPVEMAAVARNIASRGLAQDFVYTPGNILHPLESLTIILRPHSNEALGNPEDIAKRLNEWMTAQGNAGVFHAAGGNFTATHSWEDNRKTEISFGYLTVRSPFPEVIQQAIHVIDSVRANTEAQERARLEACIDEIRAKQNISSGIPITSIKTTTEKPSAPISATIPPLKIGDFHPDMSFHLHRGGMLSPIGATWQEWSPDTAISELTVKGATPDKLPPHPRGRP